MKPKLRLFVATLTMVSPLSGAIGCLDNSSHLKTEFDTKSYRPVACDCPCRYRIADRDTCLACGHFHDPKPLVFIKTAAKPHARPAPDPVKVVGLLAKKQRLAHGNLASRAAKPQRKKNSGEA